MSKYKRIRIISNLKKKRLTKTGQRKNNHEREKKISIVCHPSKLRITQKILNIKTDLKKKKGKKQNKKKQKETKQKTHKKKQNKKHTTQFD